MNVLWISIVAGVLFFAGAFMGLYALARRVANLKERVRQQRESKQEGASLADKLQLAETVVKPLGRWVPRSEAEMSNLEQRLTQAGIRRKDGPLLFTGSQLTLAFGLLLLLGVIGLLHRQLLLSFALSALAGMAAPELWLRRRVAARKERIEYALPDALDLAVITVEAGLGLDQSFLRIGDEIHTAHPDLSDELRLRNLEISMGRSRVEALRNLAARTGVDDMKALTAILIQTERFGTSVAQSLRVFADSMRTKRRQRAEERAAKMALKMIPPMVFFIFPSMFVILLGPAMIGVIRELLPILSGR